MRELRELTKRIAEHFSIKWRGASDEVIAEDLYTSLADEIPEKSAKKIVSLMDDWRKRGLSGCANELEAVLRLNEGDSSKAAPAQVVEKRGKEGDGEWTDGQYHGMLRVTTTGSSDEF